MRRQSCGYMSSFCFMPHLSWNRPSPSHFPGGHQSSPASFLADVICTHGFCPLSSLPHPRLHLPTSSLWLAVPRSSLLAQAFSSVKITAAFHSSPILVQVFQYAFQSYHLFPSGGSHGRYTVQVFRLHHKYRSDEDVDYKGLI